MTIKDSKPFQQGNELSIIESLRENKDNIWCISYKKSQRTKDKCKKIYGEPAISSKELGYKHSQGDYTLFIKYIDPMRVIALLINVDDIIVTWDNKKEKFVLKKYMAKECEIKGFRKSKYFLRTKVARSK